MPRLSQVELTLDRQIEVFKKKRNDLIYSRDQLNTEINVINSVIDDLCRARTHQQTLQATRRQQKAARNA